MPCHNTAGLLPWALSSVVAQTCEDWECIVVDDGSVDGPDAVVAVFDDPRMRLIRLPQNVGRALRARWRWTLAQGRFLAKLDADDWIYPEKLARQLERMERMLDVALVSTGIAIENAHGRLAGVRARGATALPTVAPLRRLASPPLAHAPSMIRMEIAKRYRYDVSLRRSEDAAYLLNLLREHSHCVMNDVLYAYRGIPVYVASDVLEAYRPACACSGVTATSPIAALRAATGRRDGAEVGGLSGCLRHGAARTRSSRADRTRRRRTTFGVFARQSSRSPPSRCYFRDTGARDGRGGTKALSP